MPNAGRKMISIQVEDGSLAKQVHDLETAFFRTRALMGDLLATFRLPRNRESIIASRPEDIDELFNIVDRFHTQFEAVKKQFDEGKIHA